MKKLALVVAAAGVFAASAFAQDVKVGIVDLRQVMQQSAPAKAISQQLEKTFKPRQAKLFTMEKQLKTDITKMRQDATIMTSAQKQKMQSKVMNERQALEKAGSQYQNDLNTAQSKAMQQFLGDVKVALDKVAKSEGYTLILQKEQVPYSAPDMDITKAVISALN